MYFISGTIRGTSMRPVPTLPRLLYVLCLQAFVGVLMVLVSCATVFLRSSRGDERHLGGQGGGSPRTVLNAVHSALLTMTTVG